MSRRGRELWLLAAVTVAIALLGLLVDLGTNPSAEVERPQPEQSPVVPSLATGESLGDVRKPDSNPSPPVASSPTTESPVVSPESSTARLVSRRPIVVWGFLTSSSQDPLITDEVGQGDRIVFESPSGGHRLAHSPVAGRYKIEDLRPGVWIITADIRGYRRWAGTILLLPEDLERQLDIVLDEYPKLHVRIEADRRPLENEPNPEYQRMVDAVLGWGEVRAIVTKGPPPETLPQASRQEHEEEVVAELVDSWNEGSDTGSETGRSVEESVFAIHCQLPVHVSALVGDRVLRTQEVDSVASKVVFVLTREECDAALGGLRFKVVDENGDTPAVPITCVMHLDANDSGTPLISSNSGEFRLQRLLPGPLGLEIVATGYASARLEIRVEPGTERDLGEIRLKSGTAIRGRIFSPDDSLMSFEAAKIECISLTGSEAPAIFYREPHSTTGTEGRFTITGLERGRYILRTCGGLPSTLASGPMEVSTEAGSVENVELRLRVAMRVDIKLNEPNPERCTILIEDPSHLPVAEQQPSRDGYAVFNLPSGRYSARALVDGRVVATAQFEAQENLTRVVLQPR
jgi:hypothetical protein